MTAALAFWPVLLVLVAALVVAWVERGQATLDQLLDDHAHARGDAAARATGQRRAHIEAVVAAEGDAADVEEWLARQAEDGAS